MGSFVGAVSSGRVRSGTAAVPWTAEGRGAASELSRQSKHLTGEVDRFPETVRVA